METRKKYEEPIMKVLLSGEGGVITSSPGTGTDVEMPEIPMPTGV